MEISYQKMSNFDIKSVIKFQLMILSLDFVVRITSNVQTLILGIISPPPPWLLILEIPSDPPLIKTPHLLGTEE